MGMVVGGGLLGGDGLENCRGLGIEAVPLLGGVSDVFFDAGSLDHKIPSTSRREIEVPIADFPRELLGEDFARPNLGSVDAMPLEKSAGRGIWKAKALG